MVRFLSILIGVSFVLGASAFAKPETKSKIRITPVLLTQAQFKKLSAKQRTRYIARVKDVFVEYEKMMMKYIPVVENKISIPIFFETADAGWANTECVIGGQRSPVVGSGSCSTRKHSCKAEGITDGFQCGAIFSNVCIQRVVDGSVGTISSRCRTESKDNPKVEAQVLKDATALYNELCSGEDSKKVSCQILTAKLEKETNRADAPVATTPAPGGAAPAPGSPGATGPTSPTTPAPPATPLDPTTDAAPTTNSRCYEKPSVERCAEGTMTLVDMGDGTIDVSSCRRTDDSKPFKYERQANTFAFLKFLKENKTNPVVIKGLQSFGIIIEDTPLPNGRKEPGAITFLEGFHKDEEKTHNPNFDLGGLTGSRAAAEEMIVLFNTKNELCDDMLKVRNELAQEGVRGGARKKLTFEETIKDADYNLAHLKEFEQFCSAEPPKVPPVRALEMKMTDGTVWNVFPTQITADGENRWKFQMLDGIKTTDGTLTRNREGTYVFQDSEWNIDYTIKEFHRIHRSMVNTGNRDPKAKDDSACDTFRPRPAVVPAVAPGAGTK